MNRKELLGSWLNDAYAIFGKSNFRAVQEEMNKAATVEAYTVSESEGSMSQYTAEKLKLDPGAVTELFDSMSNYSLNHLF